MRTAQSTTPTAEMALNARIIDFTSKVNGRAYRLFVSIPTRRPTPPEGHAVVYLIDGNLHFGIAVDTARIQACWPDVIDPVVVGIGYPTDSVSQALDLRMIDLTTPISEERLQQGFIAKMPRCIRGISPRWSASSLAMLVPPASLAGSISPMMSANFVPGLSRSA